MPKIWLSNYAKLVSLSTLILVIAGGLVTSTGSGLSVPDWPLSYGQFFPPMVGGIRFEHTHRVIAGIVGILSLVLMVLVLRQERSLLTRSFAVIAFLSVILQAVLGGLTVIYLLPTWISAFHASLGQTFFCLIVSIAMFISDDWKNGRTVSSENAGSLQRLLLATTGFVFLQLVLGSIIRHSEQSTIKPHFLMAFLITIHVLFITFRIIREEGIRGRLSAHAIFLCFAVITQIFLGFGAFIYARVLAKPIQPGLEEVLTRTAHQTIGAIILVAIFTLTLRAFKFLKTQPSR